MQRFSLEFSAERVVRAEGGGRPRSSSRRSHPREIPSSMLTASCESEPADNLADAHSESAVSGSASHAREAAHSIASEGPASSLEFSGLTHPVAVDRDG